MPNTTTHLITIPPGDELDFTVADDVDEDGRTYTRCVEGPAVVPVERWDDPFRRTEHWDTGDGLIISVDDVEDSWVRPVPPSAGEAKVSDDELTRWVRADGLVYVAVEDVCTLLRMVGAQRPRFSQMTEAIAAGLEQVAADESGWEAR